METTLESGMLQDQATDVDRDFLTEFDQAEDSRKWPLVRHWMKESPLFFFKQLREQRPVLVTPECTLLARYDDVVEALNLPKIFTVELYKPKMGDYLMAEDDTPMHNNDKAIMLSLLRQEDLPRIRRYIADKAREILDQAGGQIDLVDNYCRMVPVSMTQHIFGLDGIAPEKLIEWSYWNQYNAFRNQHFHVAADSTEVHQSMKKSNRMLGLYMGLLIVRKYWHILRKRPKNDTVTRLLMEHSPFESGFNLLRQGVNAGGLLIGAVETTSEAVVYALKQLFKQPERLDRAIALAKGDDEEAFDRVVWEALRFQPIAPYIFRKLSQDYTIAQGSERETKIPKGTTVLNVIASAMFDSAAFENPDEFDATRPFGKSFHFGFASHECMGKIVGMQMIPEMVRQVLIRPDIKVEGTVDYAGEPFPKHYAFSWH